MTKRTLVYAGLGGCLFTLIAGGAVLLVAGTWFLLPTNFLDNSSPARQVEMWGLTREWGNLPALPEEASDFQIQTSGGMFTRTFEASFTAPVEVIENWVGHTEPLQTAQVETLPDGSREYHYDGFEGAAYVTIWIDSTGTLVRIKAASS